MTRHDEVDEIVAAWSRERPDLDLGPLDVLSRVSRLSARVDQSRSLAFTAHDLALWEFDVLAALRRSGDPYGLSPTELARITHVTSGTMTNRITRLAARGLVSRDADPSDGRAAIVSLTAAGRELVDDALADLLTSEERLLAALPASDRTELARLLRSLMVTLDDELSDPAQP